MVDMSYMENKRFGFVYGPAEVSRITDHPRTGVFIAVTTDRECMEIRVTPGGRISVYSHEKHMNKLTLAALEAQRSWLQLVARCRQPKAGWLARLWRWINGRRR